MDFELSMEELMIKKTADEFGREVIAPQVGELFKKAEFPYEILQQLIDMGFAGFFAPEEYGGQNISTVGYVTALEEMAKYDSTIPLILQVQNLVIEVYSKFASEEQKAYWLPRFTSGEVLGSIAMTEPGAGSDLASASTTATLEGDHWILNGSKTFISNSGTERSDGMIVLASTGEENGRKKFSTFIVPRNSDGLIIGKQIEKIGWKHGDTREIFFENCRIPRGNMLGEEGKGLRHVLTGMDVGRLAFAACSTGMAEGALNMALEHAKTRIQFGMPLSKLQAIQFKLAEMKTKVNAARSLTYMAASARDQKKANVEELASMAKLFASRVAVEVVDESYQIHGGYGFTLEYPISRFYADVKMMEIGEGTSEVQKLFIARKMGC
ncbi:acyl-CoA dehydrogenase family protein [Rossellomorea marisflavi]|uniref:acyl-CoA dehydrogenase family protein n=1 Tax=Rossellomorea marisflavi TaxID=189381 RepID=UPI0027A3BCC8|nr:acyl-CoA dehydrogenase family protein [Rossellomorea marisflavi]UTE73726.1 acyl-CoA dehydrogenase family protein [Rossellomorea marisflavi]